MKNKKPDFRCPNCGTEIDVDVSALIAAEREVLARSGRDRSILSVENNQLREQIAAERQKLEAAQATINEYDDYIEELDRIAAEMEMAKRKRIQIDT